MSLGGFRAKSRTVLGKAQTPRVEASQGFYYSGFIQPNKQTDKQSVDNPPASKHPSIEHLGFRGFLFGLITTNQTNRQIKHPRTQVCRATAFAHVPLAPRRWNGGDCPACSPFENQKPCAFNAAPHRRMDRLTLFEVTDIGIPSRRALRDRRLAKPNVVCTIYG